jgi:hypothetical protein
VRFLVGSLVLQVGLRGADNNWVRTAMAWLLFLLAIAVGTVIFLGAVKGFDHLYQRSRTRAWLSLTAALVCIAGLLVLYVYRYGIPWY